MITPYSYTTQDRSESEFNYRHSRTRIVVEMTFGDLKNRFKILRKALHHQSLYHDCNIIEVCFILHNIMICLKDTALNDVDDALVELPGIAAIPIDTSNNTRAHALYFRDVIKEWTLNP